MLEEKALEEPFTPKVKLLLFLRRFRVPFLLSRDIVRVKYNS